VCVASKYYVCAQNMFKISSVASFGHGSGNIDERNEECSAQAVLKPYEVLLLGPEGSGKVSVYDISSRTKIVNRLFFLGECKVR
jgi:ATP-dependent protease Clp ATPase subunit